MYKAHGRAVIPGASAGSPGAQILHDKTARMNKTAAPRRPAAKNDDDDDDEDEDDEDDDEDDDDNEDDDEDHIPIRPAPSASSASCGDLKDLLHHLPAVC